MRTLMPRFLAFFLVLCNTTATLAAEDIPAHDVPGSHDHPIVSRFAGSVIAGYQQVIYDQAMLPLGHADSDKQDHFSKSEHVAGKITRILYVAPAGKSGQEVFRNFHNALSGAGFQTRFECAGGDGESSCGGYDYANYLGTPLYDSLHARNLMIDVLGAFDGNVHAMTAHLERTVGNVDVSLLVSQSQNYPVGVLLQIVEARPMASGEVTVDAKAMSQGLAQSGHIALYGVHFASDSAVLTKDSDRTLAEMAKLLKDQPTLKVYIVGHTDNSGAPMHNFSLSQQRAEAVAKTLATHYGIAPARLAAKGLASYAPVASNHSDAGKAQNRRVELVEQ